MAKKLLPTQETLRQLLRYDMNTGKLYWLPRPSNPRFTSRWAGTEAFTTVERGYKQGRIFNQLYYAHRIIWRMTYDETPEDIDHINGNRSDNRLENLRNVSRSENLRNRRLSKNNNSGFHSVRYTNWGAWQAYIGFENRSICLGSFKTKQEALNYAMILMRKYPYG